jgi:hypothetical protein
VKNRIQIQRESEWTSRIRTNSSKKEAHAKGRCSGTGKYRRCTNVRPVPSFSAEPSFPRTLCEMSFYSWVGLCLLMALVNAYFRSRTRSCPPAKSVRSHQKAKCLLLHSTLESRAIPNQRLVETFGIDNAFTTTDFEYHKKFVGNITHLLSLGDDEWAQLATTAPEKISLTASEMQGSSSKSLERIVQRFVFRMVLRQFFPDFQPHLTWISNVLPQRSTCSGRRQNTGTSTPLLSCSKTRWIYCARFGGSSSFPLACTLMVARTH